MAEVRPFNGIRYNPALVKDLAEAVCPPYDVIGPALHEELYRRSDYNFVRVEYTRAAAGEPPESRYARAASTLENWLKQGVLQAEEKPAIYIHDHGFYCDGKRYTRRSIIARVRLEDWAKGVIRPHEGTLSAPKADRIALLRTIKANTSPVLAMFEDKEGIAAILEKQAAKPPAVDIPDVGGESHRLWAVTEPAAISEISGRLADLPLYIADGHHRYESALFYKKEQLAQSPSAGVDEAYNFVMMELVSFADAGLLVLPPHRLLRGVSPLALQQLKGSLKLFFEEAEMPAEQDVWQRFDALFPGDVPGLVIFGLTSDTLLGLKLLDFRSASKLMPGEHTDIYKKLDVSLVDHLILEKLLLLEDVRNMELGYTFDMTSAVKGVMGGQYQVAFIIRPVKVSTIKAIADIGDRMPRKSTYFYPKAPAGLVFYRLE